MPGNLRFYLWGLLLVLLWINYQTWMHDYGALPGSGSTNVTTPAPGGPSGLGERVPEAPSTTAHATASSAATEAAAPAGTGGTRSSNGESAAAAAATLVHVRTDVLDVEINTRGGTLSRVDLLAYPKVKGEPAPVRLENQDGPQSLYELQSGLTGPEGGAYPTHLAEYQSAKTDYTLEGAQELRVPLIWSEGGVTVTKTFLFKRGSYGIGLDYAVKNGTDLPWTARSYAQILRNDPRTKSSMFNVESYAFHGPALWDGTKYRKLNPQDAQDSHLSLEVRDGWVAALQHHFVSAIVPPRATPWRFTLGASGDEYLLSVTGPEQEAAPGSSMAFTQTLFTGPKLQDQLEAVSPELGRVADYGRLWWLSKPLFWALDAVFRVTGNWGVAIIFVTFLLKLVFYPLSEASGRSMAKMKTLQPRIKNLQETYADDREKLGRAMMELYQREKINPVAGCLPIVIQIPVFLAFYWVLLESVEMRQAPFAFWIHDLSSRDPYFILPAIMAGAMFVQYKLNPAPPDPVQAKVFMIMPIVMSATFAFFPAGLVLYWVTNTILSIAQQWNINRRIAAAAARKKT